MCNLALTVFYLALTVLCLALTVLYVQNLAVAVLYLEGADLVPPADLEDGLEERLLVLERPALHQLLPVRCECGAVYGKHCLFVYEKSRLREKPFMRRAVYGKLF